VQIVQGDVVDHLSILENAGVICTYLPSLVGFSPWARTGSDILWKNRAKIYGLIFILYSLAQCVRMVLLSGGATPKVESSPRGS
jgi:hypothetical protein